MLIETESITGNTDFETSEKPDIEIKDLASVLQKMSFFKIILIITEEKFSLLFSFRTYTLAIRQILIVLLRRLYRKLLKNKYFSLKEEVLHG